MYTFYQQEIEENAERAEKLLEALHRLSKGASKM